MSKADGPWKDLFSIAKFFALEQSMEPDLPAEVGHYPGIETYSEKRRDDFLRGRYCADQAALEAFGLRFSSLPANSDRSPAWPPGVVGSISHSRVWTGAAVAKDDLLHSVGLDFESVGRVQAKLDSKIMTEGDLKLHKALTEEELRTVIFSAKESLYKAIFPIKKEFFYFDAASVVEIDASARSFKIDLAPKYHHLGVDGSASFCGKFKIFESQCLTVIEISRR